MGLKIKKEYAAVVIGFNNSSKPLGQRNDLHILLRNARANNIIRILNMFEEVPGEKALQDIQAEQFEIKQVQKRRRDDRSKSDIKQQTDQRDQADS